MELEKKNGALGKASDSGKKSNEESQTGKPATSTAATTAKKP